MINPIAQINLFLNSGHIRSQNIKINIIYSLCIKGISILTSFLMVPLTLNYLGTTQFGIWLTLSSIIAWFGFFDIGLGNGLRNKFAEAIALQNKKLARIYVSTTYAGLGLIMLALWFAFFVTNFFIDWNSLLNVSKLSTYNLNGLVLFVFTFFVLRFELKLLSIIIIANQQPAISNIFDPLANVISLIIIYILTLTTHGSLINFAIVVTVAPVLVLTIASNIFFHREYKDYKPSFKYVDFSHFKELAGVGIHFFIIQIAVLIIFSTDNIIISRILGPDQVTIYNIAYKYFNIITMLFTIIMTPLWSAYTEAYILDDIKWIKNVNRKLIKLWFIILMTVITMILFADLFYKVWVGKNINIPINLTIIMGLFILISTWNNIFVYFINGTGKIRLQLYSSVISAILNIPISIFLARNMEMGTAGVILGTCICLFPGTLLGPVQYYKIINKIDKGIWSI